ncbi:hypothetical protein ACVWYN_001281 [Pedobacter sp. UYP24]
MAKQRTKDNLIKHPEIKIDECLNLGLDADQSSEEQSGGYNNDNDQISGNSNHKAYSPLDGK